MPRFKTSDKEQAILEAAGRVFASRDFHDVLIDEVAAAAGVGKGTIYRYFETKEDLFFASVLRGFDELAAALAATLPNESSPTRRLERIASEVLAFSSDRQRLFSLLQNDERSLATREGELQKRRRILSRLIQEAILEGIRRREFRGIDAKIGAELFAGMLRAANGFRRDGDTVESLVHEILGVFTRGIERPRPVEAPRPVEEAHR